MSDLRQKRRLSRVLGSSALWKLGFATNAGRDAEEATFGESIMLHANEMRIVASWDPTGWKIEKLFFTWSELQCQGITEKRQKFFETFKHSLWVHLKDEMITIRACDEVQQNLKLNLKRLALRQLGEATRITGEKLWGWKKMPTEDSKQLLNFQLYPAAQPKHHSPDSLASSFMQDTIINLWVKMNEKSFPSPILGLSFIFITMRKNEARVATNRFGWLSIFKNGAVYTRPCSVVR